MLALIIASYELSASWITPTYPSTVKDINGAVISLGSIVKLQGTVIAVNNILGTVVITYNHPLQPVFGGMTQQFTGNNLVLGL